MSQTDRSHAVARGTWDFVLNVGVFVLGVVLGFGCSVGWLYLLMFGLQNLAGLGGGLAFGWATAYAVLHLLPERFRIAGFYGAPVGVVLSLPIACFLVVVLASP